MAKTSFVPILIIIGLINFVAGKGIVYLRGEKDPFLSGWGCRPQVEKGLHYVADPQWCDRYMTCPPGKKQGYVAYCPKGYGFDDSQNKCIKLTDGKLASCEARQAINFTPTKPKDVLCYKSGKTDPAKETYRLPGGQAKQYFKKVEGSFHTFYYCPGYISKALVIECFDPKLPIADLDGKGFDKCFPVGHYKRKQEQQKYGGQDNSNSNVGRKDMVILNTGFRIFFDNFDRPKCPTPKNSNHKRLRNLYGFGEHTNIQSNKDCTTFWNCVRSPMQGKIVARKSSCPKMEVFNPTFSRCQYYLNAQDECNNEFSQESQMEHLMAEAREKQRLRNEGFMSYSNLQEFYTKEIRTVQARIQKMTKNCGNHCPQTKAAQKMLAQLRKESGQIENKFSALFS